MNDMVRYLQSRICFKRTVKKRGRYSSSINNFLRNIKFKQKFISCYYSLISVKRANVVAVARAVKYKQYTMFRYVLRLDRTGIRRGLSKHYGRYCKWNVDDCNCCGNFCWWCAGMFNSVRFCSICDDFDNKSVVFPSMFDDVNQQLVFKMNCRYIPWTVVNSFYLDNERCKVYGLTLCQFYDKYYCT